METLKDTDLQQMRSMAYNKARKLAQSGKRADVRATADDLEQDGWEIYLRSREQGKDVPLCWLDAWYGMRDRFFAAHSSVKRSRTYEFIGLDAVPLASNNASVEDEVYERELIQEFRERTTKWCNRPKAVLKDVIRWACPAVLAVVLAWEPVPSTPEIPVDGYKVYRRWGASEPWILIHSSPDVRIVDADVKPGDCYAVTAFNEGGESAKTQLGCWLVFPGVYGP